MKKLIISLTAIICCLAANAITFPQALYVKKGDVYTKYNFGVAGDLKFGNGGHTLSITGYEEIINLDEIDYIQRTCRRNRHEPSQVERTHDSDW